MSRESILEALRQDHRRILALTENLTAALCDSGKPRRDELSDLLRDCREQLWGLRQSFVGHRCREEVGLFPDVERKFFYGAPGVDALGEFFAGEAEDDIRAHLDVSDKLKKMAGLLDSATAGEASQESVLAELAGIAQETKDLILRHASKEDEIIFPMIARLLSDAEVAAVTERLRDLCSGMDVSGE